MQLHERFQLRLREVMDAIGITQSDLAKRMNVPRQMVSQYLNGPTCPSLDVVEKFATALGLEDADVLIKRKTRQKVA